MKTMQVARLFQPMDLRIVDMPVPSLGRHDILCKVLRVGVCGTDYAIYSGEFSAVKSGNVKFPKTLGHEWSGVVAEVGSEVERFRPGDRVVGDTVMACGQCTLCLLGDYYHCSKVQAVGTTGNAWDGAYAEYILVPERHLLHLPDSVSLDLGALVEPAATALYTVRRGDVGIGDTVLVHGTGPIGIMAAALCKLCGASKVLITGRKRFKLDAALAQGADVAIDTTRESLADAVREHVGPDGVDRVIDASGSRELLMASLDLVRPAGTVATVAFYERTIDTFDIDKVVFRSVALHGVAGSLGTFPVVLGMMATGRFDPSPLITARYPLSQVHQALSDMVEKNDTRIKIMLEP